MVFTEPFTNSRIDVQIVEDEEIIMGEQVYKCRKCFNETFRTKKLANDHLVQKHFMEIFEFKLMEKTK